MTRVTDKFTELQSNNIDPRVRHYLTPKRIVKTSGSVDGEAILLQERSNQIGLIPGERCTLQNFVGREHASILVDYGREIHGSVRLMVWEAAGADNRVDLLIRTGESAQEALTPLGEKNTTNDHANRERVMNVGFMSACETNESGFRFLYVELLGENTKVSFKALQGVFIYRDLEYKGSFECSDPRVTEIWNTAAYTAHLCMQEYLWDGIKRDRLVWIGDMHTEVNTIINVFGYQDIIPKSLDEVRNETPVGKWMNGISSYSIWWLLIHCDWYRTFGDRAYLEEQREYLVKLMEILSECMDKDGSEQMPDWRFIDWPNSANPEAVHAGLQALLKIALDNGSDLLTVLGETALAEKCRVAADLLQKHIPSCNGSKQAAALMALSGLGDARELNDTVIAPDGAHGFSTFFGYYLLRAKAMAGDMEGAIRDMKTYWGGMLDMGATTFWEDFDLDWMRNAAPITDPVPKGKVDIHGDYGAYCYMNFRHSLCHGWSSGPCPFLTEYVLGVKCEKPGVYSVKPDLASLDWARGTVPTPLGVIEVSAKKTPDGKVVCDIKAPEGVTILQ